MAVILIPAAGTFKCEDPRHVLFGTIGTFFNLILNLSPDTVGVLN